MPYGIFIHALDVTERVKAKQAIVKALTARDEFLSIASHELKTPLTSLKLQIQSALRKFTKFGPSQLSSYFLPTLFKKIYLK
jgi:signal transduction histidine kinase